jgi:NADPH:quinone reductase-like Zn-dependent oxidoreductase
MKAIVHHRYGSPDVLECEDIEKPAPGDDEVLIKVRAASVNPFDWHFMRGTPYVGRLGMGLRKPKMTRLGVDLAGTVESVGRSVTQFKKDDEVFGASGGAFAEYVCASESAVVMKPPDVTFDQAAAAGVAAFTALQALRDKGRIQAKQRVLINGASGGVGTFAVQIAKSFGANVTGVCSTSNVESVRSIGADRVIDYTREDFTRSAQRYDLILDSIGNHSLSACRRVLSPAGIYIAVGGRDGRWMGPLARMLKVFLLSPFVSRKMVVCMAKRSKDDLTALCELMQAGKVTPVIDRRYELAETPQAIRYLEEGHARGKIIIEVH